MQRFLSRGLLSAVLSFGATVPAAAMDVKVTVLTNPEDHWPEASRKAMEAAAKFVFEHIADYDVAQCAYRNAFRENKDKLREKWGRQITVLNKNPEVSLLVVRKKLDRLVLGEAQLNKASIDRQFFQINHLEITLNDEALKNFADQDEYKDKVVVDGNHDLGDWVTTIAHELAHNFGYKHGMSGQWLADYPGYFPTELGFCVMSLGKYGSDLDNADLRRKYMGIKR